MCNPLGVMLGSVIHSKGGRLSKGVLPARRARSEGRGWGRAGGTGVSKAEKLSVLG